MHKAELDDHLSKADLVYFVSMDGTPYLIGDYKKEKPTGVMEPAATVKLRDLIWLDNEYLLAGPEYFWYGQYLHDILTNHDARTKVRDTLQRLLYSQPVPHLNTTLGELLTYKIGGSRMYMDVMALKEASASKDQEVYIAGRDRHTVRPGMGAVFDLPIWMRSGLGQEPGLPDSFLDQIHGCILGFKKSSDTRNPVNITIAVHLDSGNLPSWILSKVTGSHLLQTNVQMTISEAFLSGTYSIWPAQLFQGQCVPSRSESHVNDRVVIGHLEIRIPSKDSGPVDDYTFQGSGCAESCGEGGCAESCGSESGSIESPLAYHDDGGPLRLYPHVQDVIEPLVAMHQGRALVEVCVVTPLRAALALDCLHHQDRLFNQVTCPVANCMRCLFCQSLKKV